MNLKPWQDAGADFLAARRYALLADEMRVGKTLTALEAAKRADAPWLAVICPAVARFNWARSIREHLGVSPQIFLTRKDRPTLPVVVTSYDLIDSLADSEWDAVIFDESHFLRHCTAKRSQKLLGNKATHNGLIHHTERAWFLSGTPAVNHYGELWLMLYVCGVYPHDYETFVREFCVGSYGPYGFQIRGSKNHERLRELMGDFWLRRKFAEVAPELPPIEVSDYAIEMPKSAEHFDSPVLRDALAAADPMAALEAAAPAVASLRRYLGLAKVPQTADLVRATLDGNAGKLVVFTYHREVLTGIAARLLEFNPVTVAGGMQPVRRDAAVRRFQHDPSCRVFVGQIVAAGTNIDLSVADGAFVVESSWVPGENAQALMRLQNLNQTGFKFARFLGMAGSLDEQIQRACLRKTRDLSNLFG